MRQAECGSAGIRVPGLNPSPFCAVFFLCLELGRSVFPVRVFRTFLREIYFLATLGRLVT